MNPRLFPLLLLALPGLAEERPVLERKGTFVPAEPALLAVRMEAWRGDLFLAEVLAHGSAVNPGDVVARLDGRAFEENFAREEFALAQQEARLKDAEEEARLQAAAQAEQVEQSSLELEHAKRRLETYLRVERPNNLERDRLARQGSEDRIEDTKDELAQLEKLYKDDELVDATEEIVLKRQRRGLGRSLQSFEIEQRQRDTNWEVHEPMRRAEMELDVKVRSSAFERTKRLQEIARARKEGDLAKARFELSEKREQVARLRRDRDRLTVRAAGRGLFLHGAPEAAPGAGRLKEGAKVAADAAFACVADPARLLVLCDVPESELFRIPLEAAAEIEPAALPGTKLAARAEAGALPSSRGADGINLYDVRVTFEKGDLRLRPGMRCTVRIVLAEAK